MTSRQLILIIPGILLIAVAAFWLGTRTGSHDMAAPADVANTDREILYWRAPMDPTEIYDQPGKSRMGMDLEPVYADELERTAATSGVRIDPVVAQNMGIRYAVAEQRDLSRSIRTVGEVMIDEENVIQVNARVSGWLEVLHVAFDGAPVRKGDPLLEIYSPEVVTTQEEFLLALAHRDGLDASSGAEARAAADRMVAAARQRLNNWDLPASFIKMVEDHRMVHRRVVIEAPSDGVVLSKNVTQGARVMAGQELYRLADLSQVWIHASFYDFELPWISEGQTARIELSYLPGVERSGVVSYIYPFLRQKARDVHVRIIAQNPDGQLKPGMFANVQLSGRTLRDAVIVPSAAIIRSGERTLVFVDMGDGRVDPREVRIGAEAEHMVQILAGLDAGERVVVSAQFLIDSESRLQEAIAKMRGPASGMTMDHEGMDHSSMTPATGGAMPSAVRPQPAPKDSAGVDHTGHNH